MWYAKENYKGEILYKKWWHNFYEFHKLAIDELEAFNYGPYKANGFKVNKLGDFDLKLETKPD